MTNVNIGVFKLWQKSLKKAFGFHHSCLTKFSKVPSWMFFDNLNKPLIKSSVKRFRSRSFSGLYFPALGLTSDIYSANLFNEFKYGETETRKTPKTGTFYVMKNMEFFRSAYSHYRLKTRTNAMKKFSGNVGNFIFSEDFENR